jgi:hypothetical protein
LGGEEVDNAVFFLNIWSLAKLKTFYVNPSESPQTQMPLKTSFENHLIPSYGTHPTYPIDAEEKVTSRRKKYLKDEYTQKESS